MSSAYGMAKVIRGSGGTSNSIIGQVARRIDGIGAVGVGFLGSMNAMEEYAEVPAMAAVARKPRIFCLQGGALTTGWSYSTGIVLGGRR